MVRVVRITVAVCALAAILAATTALASQQLPSQPKHAQPETELMQALSEIKQGNYEQAIDSLASLVEARPNFKLAQYVYGQLMVARTGNRISPDLRKRLEGIRVAMISEVRTRWSHHFDATSRERKVPAAILQLAPEHPYAIVVDLSNNRLYLFANDNGLPRLVGDFYATIGKKGSGKKVSGDMRTPIGIYSITTYRDGNTLPALYGAGALPLNYPNAYDEMLGRTGYGIWLHGVPQTTYARAPLASEGCVAVANDVFKWLLDYVDPGETPVVLVHDVQWLSRAQAEARRAAILAQLQGWEESWEAIDTQRYLSYYASDFTTFDGVDKAAFAQNKYDVNAAKSRISVDLDQLSIFRYPGIDGAAMLKLSFRQAYRSNNFNWTGTKVQFWQRGDDGQWRIAMERSHG